MNKTAGLKTLTITTSPDGKASVSAQIDMPDMSCNLTVLLPRQNYDLVSLQAAVLQAAIDKLTQLRDLDRG